jgi:hypothetical protein
MDNIIMKVDYGMWLEIWAYEVIWILQNGEALEGKSPTGNGERDDDDVWDELERK